MLSWLHFTRWFFYFVLLAASTCCGGGPPSSKPASTREPESPRRPEEKELGENPPQSELQLILERYKIATDGDLLLVPIELKRKHYSFLLDTGCTTTTYDTCFRSLLGEPINTEVATIGGNSVTIPVFRSPKIMVGKLTLPSGSECSCVDLSRIREVSGQEIYGLLGMDFLRKHVIRIDFDRGELTFLTNVAPNAGQRIPIIFQGNSPYVRLEISGWPKPRSILVGNDISVSPGQGWFHVDTGDNTSGDIKDVFFSALVERGFLKVEGKSPVFTIAGKKTSRFGRIKATKLADFQHGNLRFGESDKNVLGLDYWSRYVVTFDFPNGALYLKKGNQFNKDELTNRSGVEFQSKNRQIVVTSVRDDSPAVRAGIKPGDVLLKIDHDKASEISLMRIRRLFCEKGREYRLLLQRGERKLALTLHLQE